MRSLRQSVTYALTHGVNRLLLPRRMVLTASLYSAPEFHHRELTAGSHDYIRYAAWRLAALEIERSSIPGDVAELGVDKGASAAVINGLFPARPLYLFDTFDGFDSRDSHPEDNGSANGFEFNRDARAVLAALPHPERAIIRAGWFPDTAVGIGGPFAFVSLDADLYAPTLAGLRFFYPRLSPGGSIFVHDCNGSKFPGAMAAVRAFHTETGAGFTAIPDVAGSVVFTR